MFGHYSILHLGPIPKGVGPASLLDGGHELLSYQVSFNQSIDRKGKAQSEVKGGILNLSLGAIPPKEILQWAVNFRKRYDGAIVVCDPNHVPQHKIYFNNARCIGFRFNYALHGAGFCVTQIMVTAESLLYEDIPYTQNWV